MRHAPALLLALAAACATSPVRPAAQHEPLSHTIPAALPPVAAAVPAASDTATLPKNWQLLDEASDHWAGVSSERAMRELLANKQPKRTVLVAVIDGGVDTAHTALRPNLWLNPHEVPGNMKDDDHNGYVDDMRGWNFIGGRDGRDVDQDTYEATRVYVGCEAKSPTGGFGAPTPAERDTCRRATADFNRLTNESKGELLNIQQADQVLTAVVKTLKDALKTDSLTDALVAALRPASVDVARAKEAYTQLVREGVTRAAIGEALKEVKSRLKFSLDTTLNTRAIVGDDTMNVNERGYGNPDVMGPDAHHGTHVSGIIGAVRGNAGGMHGIAPAVKIMMVRAVPDGDERDKDIANAIRYAVENGAQVINMSFGKGFSPHKAVVDAAVKYADAHNVLMIHASGNDGANMDSVQSFPNPRYLDGGRPRNWLEVGASSWKGGNDLAAEFSNYGQTQVDLFAPGVDILSSVPGDKYERDSGTSMAAPVVTGVAALVMSYYPELSAYDVKRILINSATRHPDQLVRKPGSKSDEVPFGALSATGGIVNAYEALKMAAVVAASESP
jgi:subtilisin family serine protease